MNEDVRKAYNDLKDVKYVIGMQKEKRYINSDFQLHAIAELYSAYKDKSYSDGKGLHPYISMHVDEDNNSYLRIEIDMIQKAHLIKEKHPVRKKKVRAALNVADRTDTNRVDDMTLDDIIHTKIPPMYDGVRTTHIYSENGSIEMSINFEMDESYRFSRFINLGYWADIAMFHKYDKNTKLSRFYIN